MSVCGGEFLAEPFLALQDRVLSLPMHAAMLNCFAFLAFAFLRLSSLAEDESLQGAISYGEGAGIAQWLERRTRD